MIMNILRLLGSASSALVCVALLSASSISCGERSVSDQETMATWSSALDGKADIYGADSRREINDPSVPETARELAASVAMVFSVYDAISINDEKVTFNRATMSQRFEAEEGAPLCADEPFAEQIAPGYCTAFLIAPDLVATAGHCVNGHTRCPQMGFVFDYARERPEDEPVSAPASNLYRCDAVIGRLYNSFEEPETIESQEYWYDWAVIRLNRPVTGRAPLRLMSGERLKRGAPIQVIGHPSGLSMKQTLGEVARDDRERYMNTTLDIYQGNSGSPAFDLERGEVQGIVIRGSGGNSFAIDEVGCGRSKRCEAIGSARTCVGNHILRIDPVRVFTRPDLKVTEQHTLTDDPYTTRHQTFEFSEEGVVDFATVHLNAHVDDASGIEVYLHHDDLSVLMIHRPRSLPYGRWTASSEVFRDAKLSGEWTLEVRADEGVRVGIDWTQVMVGHHAPEAP